MVYLICWYRKMGGVQAPRVPSLFIKHVEALGVIVFATQTLQSCIAPGAPDPKRDIGKPHESVPSHRSYDALQSDSPYFGCGPWAIVSFDVTVRQMFDKATSDQPGVSRRSCSRDTSSKELVLRR